MSTWVKSWVIAWAPPTYIVAPVSASTTGAVSVRSRSRRSLVAMSWGADSGVMRIEVTMPLSLKAVGLTA